ncbi:MAG: NAD(P)-dependent oxidoreductase [Hyphomicrobiaceae bacterium]
MTKPVILSTGLMMQSMVDALERDFETHWLNKISDVDAFLASNGSRIEGICTGAHTGVKTDAKLMGRLPNVKVIGNYGVGYDSIDVAEAAKRGIVITNTPDVLNEEVADSALGLLIMTVREMSKAEQWLRQGKWAETGFDYPFTQSLRDRKVGLIGYGRIGKAIGRRLDAFGVPMCYFGRRKQADVDLPFYDDLVAMARDVDTLLAILPGGPATEKLVNADVAQALGPAASSSTWPAAPSSTRQPSRRRYATTPSSPSRPRRLPQRTAHRSRPDDHPQSHPCSAWARSIHTRTKMGQLVIDNLAAYATRKPPHPRPGHPSRGGDGTGKATPPKRRQLNPRMNADETLLPAAGSPSANFY